ncbi:hypothetical protein [Fructobacillus cardui]|uniref:hypothetical protein n=1 Tax=Fructobacillus cardui TaxID=2893170 RepID=UPI00200B9F5A|nr:hypothetical protein [Fructobacillus cardui]MCK8627075.1 hypothetical protein [Fructobacillus cardui]
MVENELITEILKEMTPLFKRAKNTVYELRVVDQRYAGQINFFFEWNQVGRSTISRQILTVPRRRVKDLEGLITTLKSKTMVKVTLV